MSTRHRHTCRPARPVVEWARDGYDHARGWRITTRCLVCACILLEEDVTRDGADRPGAQDGGREEGEVERCAMTR